LKPSNWLRTGESAEKSRCPKEEAAARLNIHEHTVVRWAKFGLITSHAYNGHYCLYELPISELPQKHSSRWDRLEDRAAERATQTSQPNLSPEEARGVV
jgi:endonuclease/exonuclease/phosphatase family metal-dependent hydrolase